MNLNLYSPLSFVLLVTTVAAAVAQEKQLEIPDFTKGAVIPDDAKHDWNLGPTGLRGWMFCDQLVTTDARQIVITAVDQGSPADGLIDVGDVILGVGGKSFAYDPRTEFGKAITTAETEHGGGKLVLKRWHAGRVDDVVLTLPVLGAFSSTAPYNCPKSHRILQHGLKALAARISEPDYAANVDAIERSLNALALLAGGDPEHQALVQREAKWAADFRTRDFRTWYYGYVMIFLAEYAKATGMSRYYQVWAGWPRRQRKDKARLVHGDTRLRYPMVVYKAMA